MNKVYIGNNNVGKTVYLRREFNTCLSNGFCLYLPSSRHQFTIEQLHCEIVTDSHEDFVSSYKLLLREGDESAAGKIVNFVYKNDKEAIDKLLNDLMEESINFDNQSSDGIKSIVSILAFGYFSNYIGENDLTIFIDEMDEFIQTKTVVKLAVFLNDKFKNVKFVTNTHNPYFLASLDNWTEVYKVNSLDDISPIDNFDYQTKAEFIAEDYLGITLYPSEFQEVLNELEESIKKRVLKKERLEEIKLIFDKYKNFSQDYDFMLSIAQRMV